MLSKKCTSCKESKSLSEFYKRKHKFYSRCKKCINKKKVLKHRSFKKELVDLLGGECKHCGYKKCTAALEFHHTDPSKKEFSISKYKSMNDRLKEELNNVVCLCATCHREVHFKWASNRYELELNF